MRIGIIGLGFVGGAMRMVLSEKLPTFDGKYSLNAYDKYNGIGSIDRVINTDVVFLCLPTPYVDKVGFDKSAIYDTCKILKNNSYEGIVVIKSTVEPETTRDLAIKYGLRMVHNPEFLTARTAVEDFRNQKHIVIGSVNSDDEEVMVHMYKDLFPNAKISTSSPEESESMKLFANSFYAIKVQIFNEFYTLCEETGADYNKVLSMMLDNSWISPNHVSVPGPDGKLSYGGACFPKDTNALLQFMKKKGTPRRVLKAAIKERNKFRKD